MLRELTRYNNKRKDFNEFYDFSIEFSLYNVLGNTNDFIENFQEYFTKLCQCIVELLDNLDNMKAEQ